MGVHILEIDEHDYFIFRDFIAGASQGATVSNRDIFVYNGYMYAVCDNGYSSLQVIDLNFLPDSVHVVYDSDLLIQRAHSVFVDSSRAKLYVCGPKSTFNGDRPMDIFSLNDPSNPVYLGSFTYVNYVHDAFVRNDTAWLNCGDEGLYVVDFSNVAFPVILGSLDVYPDLGYNHSGWLSENGLRYVFTDENPGKRIKWCDVSDLNDIQVLSLFNSGSGSQTVAHNPFLMNNYIYVSHYYDGLQIFDAINDYDIVRVGWYDTHEQDENYLSGAWGIYVFKNSGKILLSDRQNGLYLFSFRPPPRVESDEEYGMYPNPANNEVWFTMKSSKNTAFEISIYNSIGECIFKDRFEGNNYYLNTTNYSSGTYYYYVQGVFIDNSMKGKFTIIKNN